MPQPVDDILIEIQDPVQLEEEAIINGTKTRRGVWVTREPDYRGPLAAFDPAPNYSSEQYWRRALHLNHEGSTRSVFPFHTLTDQAGTYFMNHGKWSTGELWLMRLAAMTEDSPTTVDKSLMGASPLLFTDPQDHDDEGENNIPRPEWKEEWRVLLYMSQRESLNQRAITAEERKLEGEWKDQFVAATKGATG
jgi:hypothetical protein